MKETERKGVYIHYELTGQAEAPLLASSCENRGSPWTKHNLTESVESLLRRLCTNFDCELKLNADCDFKGADSFF